jgi:flagellar FliL protein
MAPEAEKQEPGQQSQEAAPVSSSKKKSVVIIAALVMLLVGAGVPVGYFLLKSPEPLQEEKAEEVEVPADGEEEAQEHDDAAAKAVEEPELAEGEEALGAIVPLDTFVVNLSGGKYIRLQAQAELETPDIPRRFYSRVVPMRDQIISLLTQKRADELEDAQGKEKLKAQMREIMNQQLRREDVRRIYFTQFVIQ